MLKFLRKKENAKKVLWALAIIIVPLFVLWGSVSPMRGIKKENYAGKIFGKKVSYEEFNDCLQAVKTQAIIQFGDNFYKVQRFLNLESETWDRLILLYEVHKHKITATNKEVIEAIKKYPFFQGEGKFDPRMYQEVLMYSLHIAPRDFEEEIRQNLCFAKLFEEITKNVSLEDKELLDEYKKANEKVRLSFFLFTPAEFAKEVSIEAPEIKDYFESHKDNFKKPPSVNVEYLGEDFTAGNSSQEKSKILEKTNLIYSELKKGADFEKAGKDFSIQVKETGLFSRQGPITDIGWSNEFLEASFSLKQNEISQPLTTSKGVYILKLKEKKDSYIPGLREAEKDVRKILIAKKSLELAEAKAKETLEKINKIFKGSKKIDFVKLSKILGLEIKNTSLFKYGEYIPAIGVAKEFRDAAFALKNKESKISDIVSLPQGFCILKLEEYQGIDEKKFASEKEGFKTGLLDKKKKDFFNNYFEELKKQASLHDNISKPAI